MSFSRGDIDSQPTTEPNSPKNSTAEDELLPQGDFAQLFPTSIPARLAFHDLAVILQEQPTAYAWQRRFIHIQPGLQELTVEDGGSTSDDGEVPPSIPRLIHTGFWRFNMEIGPAQTFLGWVAGKGRWHDHALDSDDHGGVDILLTPDSHDRNVRGRHARFIHNLESNTFVVVADRKLRLGADYVANSQLAAFSRKKTSIAIGNLEYSLDFTNIDQQVYRTQLDQLAVKMQHLGHRPDMLMSPTPMDTDYSLSDKYIIKSSFASGSSCFVCSAIDARGTLFAVKKIIAFDQRSRNRAKMEADTMQRLTSNGDAPASISRFIEFLSIDPIGTGGATECFIISQPVISQTLGTLLHHLTIPMSSRTVLFGQLLEGLAFIHRRGCMHRDIKPGNIVISTTPLQAVIIDFGCATWHTSSRDHMQGTIRYLAPEILALKEGKAPLVATYGPKGDVWGMGLSMYELFSARRITSRQTISTRDLYDQVHSWIFQTSQSQDLGSTAWLFHLIGKLVQWDAVQRTSAADAHQEFVRFSPPQQPSIEVEGKRQASPTATAADAPVKRKRVP